jgi:3-keto-5-aminohexanoate cleavage enzyme
VQFVLGVQNAMPPQEYLLDLPLGELKRALPKATWTAAGIGRHQNTVIEWVLARGGRAIRTGPEDNIRISKDALATSNAELVKVAADICVRAERGLPRGVRAMLALPN